MKKSHQNEIWVGAEELNQDPEFVRLSQQEFEDKNVAETLADASESSLKANRRDFLKFLGFGLGAATVAAGCDIPVKKAMPYVVKPDEIVPGVATYYASSFVQGGDYCSVLVKTREGRPIKIEGNTLSKVTRGGTSARAQASVLSLYDNNRIKYPGTIENGKVSKVTWEDLDKEVMGKLNAGGGVRILANTVMSPTTKKVFEDFKAKYPNTEVVMYDPVSSSAMLEANQESFGQAVIPDYHFDEADVIVSVGADFLGTWISPVEFAGQYIKNRRVEGKGAKMSRHIQVESTMSLTGSNADNRVLIKPSEQGAAIAALYNAVASQTGGSAVSAPKLNEKAAQAIRKSAEELVAARGKSLVVSGSNNVGEQVLVNAINNMLGNYGSTIQMTHTSNQRQGMDKDVQQLVADMNAGKVGVLFVMDGANPVFDLPNGAAVAAAIEKVGARVYMGSSMNETGSACTHAAPPHHLLESWGDAEPKKGHYSLIQPTIAPLFDTRQAEGSFLTWSGGNADYFEYIKANWQNNMFGQQSKYLAFQSFWDACLHDGVFTVNVPANTVSFAADVNAAASKINQPSNTDFELALFETVNVGAGQYANNPWLMEMPDPITRTVWGNYLAIPVEWKGGNTIDGFKGLNSGELYGEADMVDVTVGEATNRLTCVKQFGLAPGTFGVALGYGRNTAGPAAKNVGKNTFPWVGLDKNGNFQYYATGISVSDKVAKEKEFACVQYHHTMGVKDVDPATNEEINVDERSLGMFGNGFQGALTKRTVIRQSNIKELDNFLEDLHHEREHAEHLNQQTLYPYEEYKENIYEQSHHWGMHVDLNACIGCSACTVACMAENNVPVVGKHEVWRHHEMTWLRIDRYYYGDFENPNVVYQPMMCQHCDNAPCENVCPVSATNHSNEGLNQMAYNRCIGTRYCANNCPYKVRRFNWLDYTSADLFPANEVDLNHHREGGEEKAYYLTDNLTRMVLNPDVTVRARGVMEKCSFCVQRIQEGKLTAKKEGRKLMDADVRTACQTACPTGAITFGDMNNKKGDLGKKLDLPVNYMVLEETDTRPAVTYTAKINNRNEEWDA